MTDGNAQPATYGRLADDIEAEIAGCRWCNQSPDSAHSVSMKHDDWMDVVNGLRSAVSETAEPFVKAVTVVAPDGSPVAAPCAISGCQYGNAVPSAERRSIEAVIDDYTKAVLRDQLDMTEKFRAELIARTAAVSETAATTWAEEAAEDIESWASYASTYFQEKHDLAGTLKKWRDRANGNSSDSGKADK